MGYVAYRPRTVARPMVGAAAVVFSLLGAAGDGHASGRKAWLDIESARGFTINEILAKQNDTRPRALERLAAVEPSKPSDMTGDATPGMTTGAASSGNGPEPFGLHALRAPDGLLWTKWREMKKDLAAEQKALDACVASSDNCADGAKRYLLIIEETRKREGRARLETVNRLFNRAIRYTADDRQHGVPDRWTAPVASLAAERGDCEDYAIAKYSVLRATGVPESDMRLVLVRDMQARVDHAVLAVRFEERWIILDNRRSMTIETADLKHYMPLFALDREGVKLFAAQIATSASAAAEEWGGEDETAGFSSWQLRGADYAAWTLRGSDAEPSAEAD